MAPWQVLRAKAASRAAPGHGGPGAGGLIGGYRVNRGPCVSVRYGAAAAPAGGRSFSETPGAREKLSMQELNSRLAAYIHKVHTLEAANEKLEQQIQEELDRKRPGDLRELDRHLQTVSLLQAQISECQTAQAQVKLQLLSAELDAFDLNAKYGEQRESRGRVEAELSDLRLMEEELVLRRLPDLHLLLRSHTQELSQLQQQHQQDVQGLLAQVSGGVAVEMLCAESWDVKQQLEEYRQKSEVLLNKNQTNNNRWFHSQVSVLSPAEASCRPSGSEVVGAELKELKELRRTTLSLQAELEQIQALNVLLENSELELREGFSLQLAGLQQRADSLGSELDSVLEATGRQATDYQTLLDIKTRLETEIQNYSRLLDGQSNRVSSSSSDSMAGVTSFCTKTNGAAFQSKAMLDKTAHVERGNLEAVRAVQTLTQDHISPVRHTAVVKPLSQTVKTVKTHSKHPESSSLTSINTRSLTGSSLTSSESQRQGEVRGYPTRTSVGTLLNCTERESKTVSTMIDKQSSPLVDKVHTKAPNLNNTVIVGTQISQDVDEEVVIQASKPEINTVIEITRIAVDTPAFKEAALQATKPEINVTGMTSAFIHTQTTKETGMQATKTEMNTVTEITKTVLGTQITKEDDVKASEAEINVVTEMTCINPGTKTAAEVEKDAVISTQTDCAKGHIQGISKGKDPQIVTEQVVSLGIESPRVTETDNTDITGKTQWIEKSEANVVEMTETREQRKADIHVDNDTKGQVWWIVQKQSQVSTVGGKEVTVETVTVELDKINSISHTANTGNTEKSVKAEAVSHIPNIEQSISTTYNSPKYSDKGVEDSNAVSHIPKAEQSLMTANISNIEHTEGTVKDAGAVSHSPSTGLSVSTSNVHKSEQSEGEIFSEVTQEDEKEGERLEEGEKGDQGKKVEEEGDKTEMREEEGASLIPKLEQSLSLCHTSISKHNEDLIKDTDTQSCIPTAEPYIPNSDKTLFADSVVASRVILRDGEKEEKKGVREGGVGREEREQEEQEKADMGEEKGEEVEEGEDRTSGGIQVFLDPFRTTEHSCQVTDSVKMATTELDSEMDNAIDVEIVNPAGQGTSLSPTEAERCISLTDSAVVLSSADPDECLSPAEAEVFLSPTNPVARLSPTDPKICVQSSPVKAEAFLNPANQELCLIDPEKYVVSPRSHDSFLSPNDPERCFSPNDPEICFSPNDPETCLSPNDPETCFSPNDPETCLSPNDPERCFSPNDPETCLSPNDPETCLSPNDPERCLSPNDPDTCLSPNDREECMSPADEEACLSLTEANRHVRPVERYILSTKEEHQSLSFSGDRKRSEDDRAAKVPSPARDINSSSFGSIRGHAGSGVSLSSTNIGSRLTSLGSSGKKSSILGRAEPKNSSWLVASATANNGRVFGKSARFGSVPATGGITFGGMASNAGGKISGVDRNRGLGGTTANGGGMASNIATSFGRFGGVVANGGGAASNISASFGSAASNSAGMISGKGGNAETATGVQGRIRHGSGERIVYGSSPGRVSSLTGSGGLPSTGSGDVVNGSMATHRATSPAGGGRFSSGGSGEWRVYGVSTGRVSSAGSGGRLSSGASGSRVSSSPSGHRSSSAGSGGRLSSTGSGGRLSTSLGSGGTLSSASGGGRRSTSVGSGGRLSSSGNGDRLSTSAGSHRISSSGRFSSTGSGEWKPVYSGASGRRSSTGSGGRPGGTTSGHRAPSPGRRLSITGGSGGRLSSATVSGNRVSSAGSGAKLSSAGSSDRLSSPAGGRISSSSGSGRTNSTGGRVITSSDGPIRTTGSGVGVNKERISVCKMAALSMSAAGRERSQERQALRSQQQKAAASSPHVQRWLTTGVGVTGNDPDGLDDIIRL
ncbi:uncharacterized protein [Centroberyx affinis]|uniref:uncharacterized protein n=1 Tax=Centroberyx affinis TaxID=166261 RepID=UPI003A5B9EF7